MSVLKVNQIRSKLRTMFEPHLDLSDIGSQDPESEPKILSRCLAAFSVYLQTGCSEREAAEAVWDGSDDNGIDAAYFDAGSARVIFVQSKWISKGAGEPAANDIGAFTRGVKDAVEDNESAFHDRLQPKFADIAQRLNTPGISVHLILVSTGVSDLATHGTNVLSKLLEELNGSDPIPIATSEVLGLTEIYSGLSNEATHATVPLDAHILDWSFIANPYPAYFGMIDGLQLKGWWQAFGRRVVSANIRHALGTTEVNLEIRNTAANTPENFWYFNNGITLVADEALKAPSGAASRSSGIFSFKGASIVNGAQTVSSLAAVTDDQALGKVRVPMRVILLESAPTHFGDDVTRTNNTQNKVESRDFVSQDSEQKRLRQEMAIEGVDYQIVRSEDFASSPTSCELTEVLTALACASGDPGLAVQVKAGIGRFYADLKKAPYRSLFNPSLSGAKAFNATMVLRGIEAWIDNKKKGTKKAGPLWGVLVHGNRILAAIVFAKLGTAQLSAPIEQFRTVLSQSDIDRLCATAYRKMVAHIEVTYPGKFLAVLFKNMTLSKDVFEAGSK
jgi:hypothetical protein